MNMAVTGRTARNTWSEQVDLCGRARALGTVIDYSANEFIFREGDPARYMYVILKGSVEVSADRKFAEIGHKGETLGILSLLDEKPRWVTVRAKEPCELAVLGEKEFRLMIEDTPNLLGCVMNELELRPGAPSAML
jgi:CRP-like cAMP-binding protein